MSHFPYPYSTHPGSLHLIPVSLYINPHLNINTTFSLLHVILLDTKCSFEPVYYCVVMTESGSASRVSSVK